MTPPRLAYSLQRLTLAFAVVAALVFALTGAYLYRSLSAELTRRDDIEISGKLNQFLQPGTRKRLDRRAAGRSGRVSRGAAVAPGRISASTMCRTARSSSIPTKPLASVIAAPHPASRAGVPFTCSPPGIGTSRCVYARETLPSGDAIQAARSRARRPIASRCSKAIASTSGSRRPWARCWSARSAMRLRRAACARSRASAGRRRASRPTT